MSDFESTITEKTIYGNMRVHYGTFFASGCAGGPVFHGLKTCSHFQGQIITPTEASITSGSIVTISGANNTSLGWNFIGSDTVVSGTMVQINTLTGASGTWMAFGR